MRPLTRKITVVAVVAIVFGGLGWAGVISLDSSGGVAAVACTADKEAFANFRPVETLKAVPDTVFLDGDGGEKRLSDYRGRGVVLNFWATWCAPCVREMPELAHLKRRLTEQGVDVLTVSEDRKGAPLVRKFYKINKLEGLDVLVDQKGALLRAFGVRGLPSTIFINQKGDEVGRVLGIAKWDTDAAAKFITGCLVS